MRVCALDVNPPNFPACRTKSSHHTPAQKNNNFLRRFPPSFAQLCRTVLPGKSNGSCELSSLSTVYSLPGKVGGSKKENVDCCGSRSVCDRCTNENSRRHRKWPLRRLCNLGALEASSTTAFGSRRASHSAAPLLETQRNRHCCLGAAKGDAVVSTEFVWQRASRGCPRLVRKRAIGDARGARRLGLAHAPR